MPSSEAVALRAQLQDLKASPPAASIAEFRQRIEALTAPYATLPPGCTTHRETMGGVPGEWTTPANARPGFVILYLHGGTYVGGSSASHRGLAARLAEACKARAFTLDFRRPPEEPFPAAVEDACRAFDGLAAQHGAHRVLVAGDSAGSALATAVALHSKSQRKPKPAGLVLLSPWSDLAFTGPSFTALAQQDPWMTGPRLRKSAELYLAHADPRDPRASPLYADVHGFPPTVVHVGADEILLDDATRLADHLRAAGVPCQLHVEPGMWHVWHLFAAGLPEGRSALAALGAWSARLPGWA